MWCTLPTECSSRSITQFTQLWQWRFKRAYLPFQDPCSLYDASQLRVLHHPDGYDFRTWPMHSMVLQWQLISPSRSLYVHFLPWVEQGSQSVSSFSPLYAVSALFKRVRHSSTDQMLLRLIFISVNTGLSSALFAFLSVILVRVDTLGAFPSLIHPAGSSSYTQPISSSRLCITRCARCTATRSSQASTRASSSEVAVRHGN